MFQYEKLIRVLFVCCYLELKFNNKANVIQNLSSTLTRSVNFQFESI